LDAVAAALLEHETIDGQEVGRLVDEAAGRRVGGARHVPRVEPEAEPGVAAVQAVPVTREPNGEGALPLHPRPAAGST
ncbi:MAG: hypothetical protein ACRDYF_18255, partial [Acidimicrobiia bacterium]